MASFRSLSAIDFTDYFSEFNNVKTRVDILEDDKTEGEDEIDWLEQAGLGYLAAPFSKGKELSEESLTNALSPLPSNQAEAVRRRVLTLNNTVRQKKRKSKLKGRRDIRDLFAVVPLEVREDRTTPKSKPSTPDSLDSISPAASPPRDFSTWRQRRDTEHSFNKWESPSISKKSNSCDWTVSRKNSGDWPHASKSDGDWVENSEDEDAALRGRSSPRSQGYYSNSAASLDQLDDAVDLRPSGKDSPPSFVKIFHAPISAPSDTWRERRKRAVATPKNLPALLKSRAWGTRTIFDAPPGGDVALIDTGVEIIGYQHVGTYYHGRGRDYPSADQIFSTEKNRLRKVDSLGSDSALSADSSPPVSYAPGADPSSGEGRTRNSSLDDSENLLKRELGSLRLIPRPSLRRENTLSRRFGHGDKLQLTPSPTEESGIGSISGDSDAGVSPVPARVKEETAKTPSFEALSRVHDGGDGLPDVFPEPVPGGITRTDDLSEDDLDRLHPWALREVTALFDRHGISFARRKPMKKKSSEGGSVFGVSLEALLEKDSLLAPSCTIPLVLQKILYQLDQRGTKEEGILRVPGHKQKIATLQREIETHFYPTDLPDGDLNLSRSSQSLYSERSVDDELWESRRELVERSIQSASCHDLAALLKQFLRDLPKPLLTYEYMDAFYLVDELPDIWDQLEALNLLVILLPTAHRSTLGAILAFLFKISEYEAYNKMSLQNVAMILAPNLFVPKKKLRLNDKDNLSNEVTFAAASCRVTKLLVKYYSVLWTVPPPLVKHVRRTFEIEQYRKVLKEVNGHHPVRRLLSRGKREAIYRKIVNEVDFQEGVLRINAHQWLADQFPVKLREGTIAADVIMRVVEQFVAKPSMDSTLLRRKSNQRHGSSESSRSSLGPFSCLLSTADVKSTVASHSLLEVGGNIGERRLDPNALMLHVYGDNPNAKWIVRCHHPGAR